MYRKEDWLIQKHYQHHPTKKDLGFLKTILNIYYFEVTTNSGKEMLITTREFFESFPFFWRILLLFSISPLWDDHHNTFLLALDKEASRFWSGFYYKADHLSLSVE